METSPGAPCRICAAMNWTVAFGGPVRRGTYGNLVEGRVFRCLDCGTEFLPPIQENLEEYYRSAAYREEVGEAAKVESYFATHDAEQWERMPFLQGLPIRGAVVADVGCGGGSFLDAVCGFAGATIGIEPADFYHASLKERGHHAFSSVDESLSQWAGRVDIAVCFSVIEHVERPVEFLVGIRQLLRPGGVLILSTPNKSDILMTEGGDAYRSFFYRSVHIHYFDATSLAALSAHSGFAHCKAEFHHRFNFANFVGWLKESRPTRNAGATALGNAFDRHWQAFLESSGAADYLYARLTAP